MYATMPGKEQRSVCRFILIYQLITTGEMEVPPVLKASTAITFFPS
jgi:hypothetical protein